MSDKLTKESARTKFRGSVTVKDISETVHDADYQYKWVDLQFAEGLKRVDRYIDKNWEVIYSKDKPKDDRKNAAQQDGTDKDLRQSPVTRTTRGGHTQIYMKILKTDLDKNRNATAADNAARDMALRKRTTDKSGNSTIREEVNMNKLGDGSLPSGSVDV